MRNKKAILMGMVGLIIVTVIVIWKNNNEIDHFKLATDYVGIQVENNHGRAVIDDQNTINEISERLNDYQYKKMTNQEFAETFYMNYDYLLAFYNDTDIRTVVFSNSTIIIARNDEIDMVKKSLSESEYNILIDEYLKNLNYRE